jgi:hypothetical protein
LNIWFWRYQNGPKIRIPRSILPLNGLVKSHKFKNFINITKSVSIRQEKWVVSKREDQEWKDRDNFLSRGIEVTNLVESVDSDFCNRYQFVIENNLFTADQININGFVYSLGTFMILNDNLDDKLNSIGRIEKIFLARDASIIKFKYFNIISFNRTQNIFNIKESSEGFCYKFYKNMTHKQSTIYSLNVSETEFKIQIRYFFNLFK